MWRSEAEAVCGQSVPELRPGQVCGSDWDVHRTKMEVLMVMLMLFTVYGQSLGVWQSGRVKTHLTELEDALLAGNEEETFDGGQNVNADMKLHSDEASEAAQTITSDKTVENTDYDETLTQRLAREEEERMLVAGLHLDKRRESTETREIKHRAVSEDGMKAIRTTLGPAERSFTYSLKADVLSSTEAQPSNVTEGTENITAKSTGNERNAQTKEKGTKKNVTSPLKSSTKTVVKMEKNKKRDITQKEHFPYFLDNYCPPECACYGRVVQCSDKGVDRVPYGIPYDSRYVLLMNNRIDRVQLDLLAEYRAMEFLALTNNRLTDGAIEGAFHRVPALKRLYLDTNRLQSVPSDLPMSLEELRLDNNQVGLMLETPWTHCPGLLILSMSNNSLGNGSNSLPKAVLSPLCKLQTLNLDYNQLSSFPLGLPLSIKELYLKGNQIEEFHNGAFNGKSELVVLDLSKNRLTNKGLFKDSLINATHLESLNLEGNRLKQIPQHLPSSLKTLNLEGNVIKNIKKLALGALKNLEHLGLARNQIFKVAAGAFRALPALHQLDLGHNALTQVPRQLPMSLHSVALTHNRIEAVPRDAFCWGRGALRLSGMVRVQLQNNPMDRANMDTEAFRCLRGFQVVHFH